MNFFMLLKQFLFSIEDNFGTIFETRYSFQNNVLNNQSYQSDQYSRPGLKNWTDFWSPAYPSESSGNFNKDYCFYSSKKTIKNCISNFMISF